MAAPAFVKAGTAVVTASGSAACTLAGTTAGNLIILQVFRDGTASAVTLSAITNLENLAGTDNTLTDLVLLQPVGSPTAAAQSLYIGRSLGGTVSVTVATAGDDLYYRLYEFSGAATGTTLAAVTESIANGVGLSNIVSDTGVTTSGANRLVCQFVAVNDDNLSGIGAFAGASTPELPDGSRWFEAVPAFASATGTDGSIQLQLGFTPELNYLAAGASSIFGNSTARTALAQPFTAPRTETLNPIFISFGRVGAPTDDVTVRIETDASSKPSGTLVGAQVTLDVVSGIYMVSSSAPVTAATKYWIVVGRTGAVDAANYYVWPNASGTYASHSGSVHNGTSWAPDAVGTRAFGLVAPIASGGTMNGGTMNMIDSDSWGVVGLALIPPPSGPATLERNAALAAVGLVAAIGRETLARLAALNATGAIASSGIKVMPGVTVERAAALAATGLIASAGRETLARTAAFAATGQIAAAGISIVPGRAAIGATATITAVGRETLARSAAVTATAAIASAGREQLARLAELAAATNISVAGQVVSGAEEVERSATIAATAQISTVGRETLARTAAVGAAATITTVGRETLARTAAVSATAAISSTGQERLPRAVVVTAAAQITAVGRKSAPRAAALTATATITAAGQKRLQRSAAVTTTAAVTAAGEQQGLAARAAALTAAAAVTVAGEVEAPAERTASLAATAAVTASGVVVHVRQRSAVISGTGTLTSVPQRALGRAATVSSSPTVATVGRKLLSRTAALDGNAAITTTAGGNIGEASFTAISTITVTLPWPAGAISTPTTGLIYANGRGGIRHGTDGEIATGSQGVLARTGG